MLTQMRSIVGCCFVTGLTTAFLAGCATTTESEFVAEAPPVEAEAQVVSMPAEAPAPPPASVYVDENRFESNDVALYQGYTADSGAALPTVAQRKLPGTDRYTLPPDVVMNAQGREAYAEAGENPFLMPKQAPLSTFSIDVDTASYSNVRRMIEDGQVPPAAAVRIEELVNYFDYSYPQPEGKDPFSVMVDVAQCPWTPEHRLARIAIKGREVKLSQRPTANLVFLVDVSGSMDAPNKLPLVQESLKALLKSLRPDDHVAIVTYAGNAGVVLPPTLAADSRKIIKAIDELRSGGSTAGAAGINTAYDLARKNFNEGRINRVILATDGDFNVGMSDRNQLIEFIRTQADSGVALTALGYGMGNLQDATLERLADFGDGNYAYIDDYKEARRVLNEKVSGTLVTIAKDVKIQVEFNPAQVAAYRLIGYENRALNAEDFNNDRKDAGEIGAGHTVTALYELVPVGVQIEPSIDSLKYQENPATVREGEAPKGGEEFAPTQFAGELMTVKLRYKQPDAETSQRIEIPVQANDLRGAMDNDFRFAAAVAAFGMQLRNSSYDGAFSLDAVQALAEPAVGGDEDRREFLDLVVTARTTRTR